MHGVSVCLITKNAEKTLGECLDSLQPFLRPEDEVVIVDTGSTDGTTALAESRGARVLPHPELCVEGMLDLVKKYLPDHFDKLKDDPQFANGFLSDFAAARQLSTDAAKNEIVFWLDADDVLQGGAQLRTMVDEFFKDEKNTCLFLPYDYSFDTDGKCNTVLWRERILRRQFYEWKGRCHESMIPKGGTPQHVQQCGDESIRILHKNGKTHEFSDVRNYAILQRDYDASEWKDPRTEFYLGNACRGLKRWLEAIQWYSRTLERSGSRDDRLSSCLNIGYCYLMFGRPWRAIDWFHQAIKIYPLEPRAYYGVARGFFEVQRYKECLAWTQFGRTLGTPNHITSVDPQAFDFYPIIFEVLALRKLNQRDLAVQTAQQAIQMRPTFKPAQELYTETTQWAALEKVKDAVGATLSLSFSPDAAKEIVRRLKPEVRKAIPDFQIESTAPHPHRTITFFCGKTLEAWDPSVEATGVGGSEKMVIQLARRFAERGWRVDVYGNPTAGNAYKVFDKVTYKPSECFNPDLERDILILWRSPALLDYGFKARKVYVDMHDVAHDPDFTADRMKRCAGVFWKSKFHRQSAPSCPEDKCIYTQNGIDVSHFMHEVATVGRIVGPDIIGPGTKTRNYKKIVWCSSGDRGLYGALMAWGRIANEFPDAQFHVFYGFTPLFVSRAAQVEYQYFGDIQAEHHMLDYAERCYTLMDRLGCIMHGRVGHKELAAHLSDAGVWLYPTKFPEISCMSAMEAQAAGAFPICSNTGALAETVKYGTIVDPLNHDEIIQAIRGVFTKGPDLDSYRRDMQAHARREFDLEKVVDQWLAEFAGETDRLPNPVCRRN